MMRWTPSRMMNIIPPTLAIMIEGGEAENFGWHLGSISAVDGGYKPVGSL